MATYSYTKLADYILDQLWGFASVNSLKNSLRYIGEDVLGDPSANSDKVNFSQITAAAANAAGLAMTSTGANNIIEKYTRATGTSVGLRGVAISNASGVVSTSSSSLVDVTNLSVTIITAGRPVYMTLIPNGAGGGNGSIEWNNNSDGTSSSVARSRFAFVRDGVSIADLELGVFSALADTTRLTHIPCGCVNYIDAPAAGTYVYKVQYSVADTDQSTAVYDCKLAVFEL